MQLLESGFVSLKVPFQGQYWHHLNITLVVCRVTVWKISVALKLRPTLTPRQFTAEGWNQQHIRGRLYWSAFPQYISVFSVETEGSCQLSCCTRWGRVSMFAWCTSFSVLIVQCRADESSPGHSSPLVTARKWQGDDNLGTREKQEKHHMTLQALLNVSFANKNANNGTETAYMPIWTVYHMFYIMYACANVLVG